jgi:hypothetical protein
MKWLNFFSLAFWSGLLNVRLSISSGGGGSSGTTRYEWNDDLKHYWQTLLAQAGDTTGNPYQQYNGERVAAPGDDRLVGQALTKNFIYNPQDSLYGQGNMQYQDTLAGDYLNGSQANPNAGMNAYIGLNNPQFTDMLSRGQSAITDKYQQAIAPQINADAVMNGTFGGGDHQKVTANAQQGLAKSLGDYTSGMQNDQYNRSGQLYEQSMGRGMQAYEGERNRMMQAGAASQADQGLTLDRYRELENNGDYMRQYQQQLDDQGYQDWFDQNNYGKNQLSWMSQFLTAAQGGLPANQTMSAPRSSGVSNALGTALGAYGLFRS